MVNMKGDRIYDLQRSLSQIEPLVGSRWIHYRGDIYKVIAKAIESNEPHRVKVIYESETFGYVWEHPLEEWDKLMELEDGSFVKRFSLYPPVNLAQRLEDQWDC